MFITIYELCYHQGMLKISGDLICILMLRTISIKCTLTDLDVILISVHHLLLKQNREREGTEVTEVGEDRGCHDV